jgi:hypothetical protein
MPREIVYLIKCYNHGEAFASIWLSYGDDDDDW